MFLSFKQKARPKRCFVDTIHTTFIYVNVYFYDDSFKKKLLKVAMQSSFLVYCSIDSPSLDCLRFRLFRVL